MAVRARVLNTFARFYGSWMSRGRTLLPTIFAETTPLDLRFVGRVLFHAALVGIASGFIGALFFFALELVQGLLLEDLAGYTPLRAFGETAWHHTHTHSFRPWVLLVLPALGGLACGLITQLAPEARGGGGDAMIRAFHDQGGKIRTRVIPVKALASLFTLGTGGAGGREGPTMQIGGAIGSAIARVLKVSSRERRILMVAGVAAGIAAVFRTPLGAALLAVEVLYRDGFESDALVPSVLSSVVAYSVVILIFGETTLFAHAARFPFVPVHLLLYALLALPTALLATGFVAVLGKVRATSNRLPVPAWARPALGGLALGAMSVPILLLVGPRIDARGQGLGILGGGYGAVQMAITGATWLPLGWTTVGLLVLLSIVKLFASSLTIGTGGSAGDFAPSLAIGGLFGGAFGRAAQLLLHDPRIDPGAFALVGMGVFYGGIAHIPLSALVLVCELAGNYDLLVPLMLAQGIAFVALRKRSLYEAQVPTQRDSPVHRDAYLVDVLRFIRVKDLMTSGRPFVTFGRATSAADMLAHVSESTWQDVFPVVDEDKRLVGVVSADAMRVLAAEAGHVSWAVAVDIMQAPVSVQEGDDLRVATERLVSNGLREIPVVDDGGEVIGFLDEQEVAKIYLRAEERSRESGQQLPPS
jgi:chloride channel protein, CIC family